MRQFKTERRLEKIRRTANWRQESLRVVFENIHDPHNVSAILRSCDAVGVQKVGLVYNTEQFPKLSKVTSSSATKWIDVEKYKSVDECCAKLKRNGYKIYSSILDENAVGLYDLDLTEKVAIVMGNEHRGISDDFQKLSDKTFYIPMRGMIQSLNVSVAAAVILYEAQRQRFLKGMYDSNSFSNDEIEQLIDRWCDK